MHGWSRNSYGVGRRSAASMRMPTIQVRAVILTSSLLVGTYHAGSGALECSATNVCSRMSRAAPVIMSAADPVAPFAVNDSLAPCALNGLTVMDEETYKRLSGHH